MLGWEFMTFWHLKKEIMFFSPPSQVHEHNKMHQRLNVPPKKGGEGMVQKPERERRGKRKHISHLNDMKMNHTF